ncbi:hypothetical protein [Pseudomonas phage LUZ7]|uniref:Uncharacterized protein n=1 Tax=Pseudomonas phage LUZ7 TaxID=655097 RepID=C8ZKJ8_9CAUD|nr:hypothetical protein PP-LUZ7_gp099 [Pseudomonas phage LUZ7]CAZ66240.1 hypothetical protein [Pseudomonas phage LUZ7]
MYSLVLSYKCSKEGVPSYLLAHSETPDSLNHLSGANWFRVWDEAKEIVMKKGTQ